MELSSRGSRGTHLASVDAGGQPASLRRRNRVVVLRLLHGGGEHTISAVAAAAGLSRPTTQRAIEDLVADDLVRAVGADRDERATVGRPAERYALVADARVVVGVDFGGHQALAMLSDLTGTILDEDRIPLDPTSTATLRNRQLETMLEAMLARLGDARDRVHHAVVATPGTIDHDGTIVFCPAIPEAVGSNPRASLAERFPFVRWAASSDMPMAALAERWKGAATHADSVVYLHVGRRPGGAALIAGRPHDGFHLAASQLGLWRGNAWRAGSDRLFLAGAEHGPDGWRGVFEAAATGDEGATCLIDDLVDNLVAGIAPTVVAIDPQLLVVGGGISSAGEGIAAPVRSRLRLETPFPPDVVASLLGNEAVALGAVRRALDDTEQDLFDLGPA